MKTSTEETHEAKDTEEKAVEKVYKFVAWQGTNIRTSPVGINHVRSRAILEEALSGRIHKSAQSQKRIAKALEILSLQRTDQYDTVQSCLLFITQKDDLDNTVNSDVDEIVPTTDDPDIPINTFRTWFLGMTFSVLGAAINNFFAERLPGISISAFVAQLIAYPAGKLLERTLPTTVYTYRNRSWSFNPGPFNAKEHMLITVMANVSFSSAYATSIIITQRLPMFYNQQWASNWWYQILLVMSSQIIGYGLAGIARRFIVYPATAVWPGILPVLALNRSFHDDKNEPANGKLGCINHLAL